MTLHQMKTHPDQFAAVMSGVKTFDFRAEDDRRFAVGDELYLAEYDPKTGFTGRNAMRRVSYLLRGPIFGIPEGYVVLSIVDPDRPIRRYRRNVWMSPIFPGETKEFSVDVAAMMREGDRVAETRWEIPGTLWAWGITVCGFASDEKAARVMLRMESAAVVSSADPVVLSEAFVANIVTGLGDRLTIEVRLSIGGKR